MYVCTLVTVSRVQSSVNFAESSFIQNALITEQQISNDIHEKIQKKHGNFSLWNSKETKILYEKDEQFKLLFKS